MIGIVLSVFEAELVAAIREGRLTEAPRPDRGEQQRVVRGALAHGNVHWRGVRLMGVLVVGDVDLSYCSWSCRLELRDCLILGDVDLAFAKVSGVVSLSGSHLGLLRASRAESQARYC